MFRLYHWEWAGLTLYGFGLAAATGFALLWVALTLTRRRFGAASGTATWLMVLGIPLGLFMGRVVFCLLQPGAVFFDPVDGTYLGLWPLIRIWQGGLNAFGLMAGLAAAVLLTAVITHQSKTTLFDWAAAPAALLLSVLCFGLILAGEGYGSVLDKPNPLPGMVNDYGEWYLAVYLLEGVVYALIAVILSAMKNPRPGGRALGLLSLAGCAQLFLSSLHRDNYTRLETRAVHPGGRGCIPCSVGQNAPHGRRLAGAACSRRFRCAGRVLRETSCTHMAAVPAQRRERLHSFYSAVPPCSRTSARRTA